MKKQYSRTRKNVARGFAAVIGIIGAMALAIPVKADNQLFTFPDGTGYYIEYVDHLYPETGIITEIEYYDDYTCIFTVTVANGNQFEFYDTLNSDWYLNDIVSMLMDSKGTEIVYDDEIVLCKYSGTIDYLAQWEMEED